MNADLEQVRQYIVEHVADGFYTREEIVDAAADYANDELQRVDLDAYIEMMTDELLDAHFQAQRTWPYPTDCDRLDTAFAELDAAGILARQNFACCQTCGHAEMQSEIAWVQEHRPVEGYVFYHMQDTESARDGYGLYLAYGAVQDGDEPTEAVGWRIVDALKQAGLEVSWNGSVRQRIYVRLDWKRRRL